MYGRRLQTPSLLAHNSSGEPTAHRDICKTDTVHLVVPGQTAVTPWIFTLITEYNMYDGEMIIRCGARRTSIYHGSTGVSLSDE